MKNGQEKQNFLLERINELNGEFTISELWEAMKNKMFVVHSFINNKGKQHHRTEHINIRPSTFIYSVKTLIKDGKLNGRKAPGKNSNAHILLISKKQTT